MLNNGRKALESEHPCFLMDGTGTNTGDRWRNLLLTAYDGGVNPVAFGIHYGEDADGFAQLLQCVMAEGAIENSRRVYVVTDARDVPNFST